MCVCVCVYTYVYIYIYLVASTNGICLHVNISCNESVDCLSWFSLCFLKTGSRFLDYFLLGISLSYIGMLILQYKFYVYFNNTYITNIIELRAGRSPVRFPKG